MFSSRVALSVLAVVLLLGVCAEAHRSLQAGKGYVVIRKQPKCQYEPAGLDPFKYCAKVGGSKKGPWGGWGGWTGYSFVCAYGCIDWTVSYDRICRGWVKIAIIANKCTPPPPPRPPSPSPPPPSPSPPAVVIPIKPKKPIIVPPKFVPVVPKKPVTIVRYCWVNGHSVPCKGK